MPQVAFMVGSNFVISTRILAAAKASAGIRRTPESLAYSSAKMAIIPLSIMSSPV